MENDNTMVNALIGAVVTLVTSFIPFSPILGGAAAAYLSEADADSSVRIGAISGVIATIPMALFGFFVMSILFLGSAPGGFVVFLLLFGVLSLVYTAGLSALGGFLVVYMTNTNRGIDVTSQ
ncbi:hypothetical protein SAMN05421858_0437 [Haladaptatus litoreus]|uniref:DUF5518 domain-containing protein n=1 Tax=Haladaptatus litoreus TaxID=553468 RepID=A0A1N6VQ78_9EURY|nr:DUF5518 domain-containing protein [Haladaptatus litoreus]SIQ79836.1 hypothetical protein SAMN05421858_0437 [Haladaptatus litoreus]